MIALKHWLFQHITPIGSLFGLALVGVVAALGTAVDWPALVGITGIPLSVLFFVQKQRLEELTLFRDLFRDFNVRYDGLNERLADIALEESEPLTLQDRKTLVDYFNLCSEEYLYYRQGYILPEAWSAWVAGMMQYYSNPRVRAFWDQELLTGSYYGMDSRLLKQVQSKLKHSAPRVLQRVPDSLVGAR